MDESAGLLHSSRSKETRFDTRFEPLGDWPLADGTLGTKDVLSDAHLRRADKEMLRVAFRRCFLKKTQRERQAEDLAGVPTEYQVFMAVAEKVGYDRRGAPLYKRSPDGEELLEDQEETERVRYRGEWVTRTLRRKRRIPENDLPGLPGGASGAWSGCPRNQRPYGLAASRSIHRMRGKVVQQVRSRRPGRECRDPDTTDGDSRLTSV